MLQLVAAGTTAVLAAASALSMAETFFVLRAPLDSSRVAETLPDFRTLTSRETVRKLSGLDRKELLYLFRECPSPDSLPVRGDFEGVLLKGHNPVITRVSAFISHVLFGDGRWAGKSFREGDLVSGSTSGINRFRAPVGSISRSREFDCAPETSAIDGRPALVLRYSRRHGNLSPWKSMVDELRVVRPPDKEKGVQGAVLLGMGYMGWSGGALNNAPFCLYAEDDDL